jgi:hypothetical protein
MSGYPKLGEFVFEHNPYGGEMPDLIGPGLATATPNVDVDPRGVYWSFGGQQHHVCKAMRIPYTVPDDDGSLRRLYLLVGIEGVIPGG